MFKGREEPSPNGGVDLETGVPIALSQALPTWGTWKFPVSVKSNFRRQVGLGVPGVLASNPRLGTSERPPFPDDKTKVWEM